jgi:hypothetical protein
MLDERGIPWLIELAVAETEEDGHAFYGLNYSPVFSDPLSACSFDGHERRVGGANGLLREADALPGVDEDPHAVALHIVCPALEFEEPGKTRFVEPPLEIVIAIEAVFRSATKDLFTKRKQRERNRRARQAAKRSPAPERFSLKEAVFKIIKQAAAKAGGGLRFSVRSLYYQVRPLIQSLTDKELGYSYFSQTLAPEYEREHGALDGMYREPRGHLHEPHSGVSVPLGTIEVERYTPTDWTFDKILYVEKEGLWPTLQDAQLAERFDIAVIVGQGYAVEACRAFLESVDPGAYRIFCLHDADPAGCNIAITLAEETKRMPGYAVEVTDLGLTVAEAKTNRLPTEAFTRKVALPARLQARLDAGEQAWFIGTPTGRKNEHACKRVELNAFTGPDLVVCIERRLEDKGATAKLVPPAEVVDDHAAEHHEQRARAELIAQLHPADRVRESCRRAGASDRGRRAGASR